MEKGSLNAVGLGKQFPGVIALNDVQLEVPRGAVTAIVGANGAGKSTLIKILTGYYDAYEGSVTIDGQPVVLHQPSQAAALGVQAVYQEVDTVLIPYLTVTENLLINDIVARSGPIVHWRAMHRRAQEMLARVGMTLDVHKRVEELVLHEKQMLVIARAVSQQVRYLIFDEPTTSLSLGEVDQLFDVIRALKAQGVGIIYISHRLMEVQEVADNIVVLRGGQKVAEFPAQDFNISAISEAMLGSALTEAYPPKLERQPGPVVLEVADVRRGKALRGVSLQARKGEILGIAGLVGAGKTELLRAIFGADSVERGAFTLDGRPVTIRTPGDAVGCGIFLIPEERRAQGVLVGENVRKNLSLPFLGQFSWTVGLMNQIRERSYARQIIDQVGMTPPNPEIVVGNLSGGNQQKIAIGKWFGNPPRVMLFDEATQGIDIKAKKDVYKMVQQMSTNAAVIYASSDIDEVIGVADRVLVMHDGRVVAELVGDQMDRNLILEYATGARTAPAAAGVHVHPEGV